MSNWKPTIKVFGEAAYHENGQTFATKHEAEMSALTRFHNWTMAQDYGTVETDEPVNYKWVESVGDVRLEED